MRNFSILTLGLMCLVLVFSGCTDDAGLPDYSKPAGNVVAFKCASTFGESNHIIWNDASQIGLFCDQIKAENIKLGLAADAAGTPDGLFYSDLKWGKGEHKFDIYYPYNSAVKNRIVTGMLNDTQLQISDKVDHLTAGSLMYANVSSQEINNLIPVDMKCAFGYLNYSLFTEGKYAEWSIKSVKLSTTDNTLAGSYSLDLATGILSFTSPLKTLTVNVSNAALLIENEAFEVFAVTAPGVFIGKQFKVSILIQKDGQEDLLLSGNINPPTKDLKAGEMLNMTIAMDDLNESSGGIPALNLAKNGTANCYVAGVAGQKYSFPATIMGNGAITPAAVDYAGAGSANGIIPTKMAPKSAQLLWQTAPALVTDVTLRRDSVFFTLNGSSTIALTEGNAVIAVYDQAGAQGNILWSWHIWVTAENLASNLQTYNIHADYAAYGNYQSPVMMDRNLGATETGRWVELNNNNSHGLRYQWGRKDPIVNSVTNVQAATQYANSYDKDGNLIPAMAASANLTTDLKWAAVVGKTIPVADIAKYPMNFVYNSTAASNRNWLESNIDDLWGNPYSAVDGNDIGKKSIYDPCPQGYRVPHTYVWSGFTSKATGGAVTGLTVNLASGDMASNVAAGGVPIKYDGSSVTTYPLTGFIALVSGAPIQRVGNNAGSYWASMSGSGADVANVFYFDKANFTTTKTNPRAYGYSVRCMKE